jgi:hypothetical protein
MGNPSFSHRGDRILVQYYDDKSSEWKVGIISAVDGKLLETADISVAKQGFPLFSPDDKSLIYGETHNSLAISGRKLSVAASGRKSLTFPSELMFDSVMTPDSKLVMARGHTQSDAILVRNFR